MDNFYINIFEFENKKKTFIGNFRINKFYKKINK